MMPLLTLLRLRGTTPTAATRVTRRWRQKITYSRNTPRGSRPGRVRWQNNIGTAVGARRSAAMYLAGFLAADRMTTFDHTARLASADRVRSSLVEKAKTPWPSPTKSTATCNSKETSHDPQSEGGLARHRSRRQRQSFHRFRRARRDPVFFQDTVRK